MDLRDAIRSLRATPIVTIVGVLSLALGIGANTALFTILNSLVLRQLPVREPQQLVMIGSTDWTNPIWEEIRDRKPGAFESVGAWSFHRFNLAESGRMDPVGGAYVSGGLFQTLGVRTVAGRAIAPADDVPGGGPDGNVAVVSYRFWQQRFGGVVDVLGRRLTVNRVPFTIVGVAPPGFQGPEVGEAMDVFVPLASEAQIRGSESALARRSSWWLQVVGRLAPDHTIDTATAAFNAIRPAIREATLPPEYTAEYRAGFLTADIALYPAATGVSSLRDRFEQPLTIILVVVAAVLLIACANIASLMLARASARRHEMSVRLALGASRLRLASQMFAESLLLAIAGGIAGLAVAKFGAALLVRQLASETSAVILDLPLDWRVLGFTAAVSLGATLLFGLAPALGLGDIQPNDALKEQSRSVTGDRRLGLRNALVVAQVALSFALVAGAALFVRTFTTLATTPLGFDPSALLIVSVESSPDNVAPENHTAFAEHVTGIAATVAGVSRASLSYLTPMSGRNWTNRVQVFGGPTLARTEQTAWVNAVAPGWFETYGMRLLAGRDISPSDVTGAEPVAVVNAAFVRRFVGSQSPLGQRIIGLGLGQFKERIIVGVVNDAVYRTVRIGAVPTMYLPMAQSQRFGFAFSVTARGTGQRPSLQAMTETLSRDVPNLAFSLRDYTDQVRATLIQERLVAMLSGFFGLLAILLAALGLYGVTSYSVSRRRQEIAVRMALGATAISVIRLVLHRVGTLVLAGEIIGVMLSFWAATYVGTLLFRVEPRDPITLIGVAALLAGVGLFAGWLPAHKASRVDPGTALRN